MKRQVMAAALLAATGGFVIAGPAGAQDEPAAGGFQLTIGGFYNALAIVRDQDDPVTDITPPSDANPDWQTGKANIRNYDFNQYGVYSITGSQTLDNGLELGFTSDHEVQTNFNTDRAFVYASGGFGRLHFGADRSAMYRLYEWSPTAGWGVDFTDYQEGVASLNGLGYATSAPYIANQELMLTYMTPRFSGLQAGVSFAPDTDGRARAGEGDQRFVTDSSALDEWEQVIELGLNYSQSFDGFDLGWSGGFGTARLSQESETINDRRRYVYSTGLNVGAGGFDVGATYKFDTHGSTNNIIGRNIRPQTPVGDPSDPYDNLNDAANDFTGGPIGLRNQHNVNAGLTYTTGPWTVGPSFGWTRESAGAEREMMIFDFGARYSLAPGADLVGSLQYADYDEGKLGEDLPDDVDGDDFGGDGVAGLLGIQLNF